MIKIEIYTDGACSGNPGPGGWGAVLVYDGRVKKISGFEKLTTNNRMEIKAVIEGLSALKKPCDVTVYSDSSYVIKGMQTWVFNWQKNNWKTTNKKPVKNADLWQELLEISNKHVIDWCWVKGHAGNAGNEEADRLATDAIDNGVKK